MRRKFRFGIDRSTVRGSSAPVSDCVPTEQLLATSSLQDRRDTHPSSPLEPATSFRAECSHYDSWLPTALCTSSSRNSVQAGFESFAGLATTPGTCCRPAYGLVFESLGIDFHLIHLHNTHFPPLGDDTLRPQLTLLSPRAYPLPQEDRPTAGGRRREREGD